MFFFCMKLLEHCKHKGASGCVIHFENGRGLTYYISNNDVDNIELYYDRNKTLNKSDDIADFLALVKPPYITSVKIIPEHSFRKDVTDKFVQEVSMLKHVYNLLDEDEHTIRPVSYNVGSKSREAKVFGFILTTKNKEKIHLIPQEFCGAGSLEHQMDEYDRTNDEHHYVAVIKKTIREIYDVLIKLHTNGVVHNDVHANNIVVCENRVKLIDYGMSFKADNNHKGQLEDYRNLLSTIHQLLFLVQHREGVRDLMRNVMDVVRRSDASFEDMSGMLKHVHSALTQSGGGNKVVRTVEKVIIQGKTRVVYKNKRGKKFVKWNGSFVHLARLQ